MNVHESGKWGKWHWSGAETTMNMNSIRSKQSKGLTLFVSNTPSQCEKEKEKRETIPVANTQHSEARGRMIWGRIVIFLTGISVRVDMQNKRAEVERERGREGRHLFWFWFNRKRWLIWPMESPDIRPRRAFMSCSEKTVQTAISVWSEETRVHANSGEQTEREKFLNGKKHTARFDSLLSEGRGYANFL